MKRFDNGRRAWFAKLAGAEPEDRGLYVIVLDVDADSSDFDIADSLIHGAIEVKYGDKFQPAPPFYPVNWLIVTPTPGRAVPGIGQHDSGACFL